MENIGKQAERKLNEGADKAHNQIEKTRKQGMDVVEDAMPVAEEAIAAARAQGNKLWSKTRKQGAIIQEFIEERPFLSLGVALAVGVGIGALLVSRRKS